MNKYESIIIISPNLKEDEYKELQKKYEDYINENGKLKKTDVLGIKKLAYEINKNKEGAYIIFYFESDNKGVVGELERQYRNDEKIIKFLTMKVEEFV